MKSQPAGQTLVLVGCGNIGSFLAAHLARLPGVRRLVLIDSDAYELKNIGSQDVARGDVSKSKVAAQAARLKGINSALEIVAIHDAVENVPLAWLRGDVILAALDSRAARRYVNQAAWRLGMPWIDSGVAADGLLARVNVYRPASGASCLECAWSVPDYVLLEQHYACPGGRRTLATNAPSSLGALAAALAAIECGKILAGQWERVAVDKQVLIDGAWHKHYLTVFRRNPACRFDHAIWKIQKLNGSLKTRTVGWLLGRPAPGRSLTSTLQFENAVFVRRLTCPDCAATRAVLRLRHRLLPPEARCRKCGAAMVAAGADMLDKLNSAQLARADASRTLKSTGFRVGDVVTVRGNGRDVHYELSGAADGGDTQ